MEKLYFGDDYMINQKTVLELAFWPILGVILFLIYTGTSNREPAYTKSEVSALMKFNASEFGCISVGRIFWEEGKFKLVCYTEIHNPYMGESRNIIVGWNKSKTVIYFPHFDGIKIQLEPERQECRNETIEVNIMNNRGFVEPYHSWMNFLDITNDFMNKTDGYCIHFADGQFLCGYNKTKCQTTPAVTKILSGWAVSESDLATEFCKAKTATLNETEQNIVKLALIGKILDECPKLSTEEESERCIIRYGNLVENGTLFNSSFKPFTRGEVVGVPKCSTINERVDQLLGNKECLKLKVIRCSSDGGTQKDFEVLK